MVKEVLHSDTWFKYDTNLKTPESTTHESLKVGIKMQTKQRIIARKQLNFQSYPMNDFRFELLHFDPPVIPEILTTYRRAYVAPNLNVCKPKNIHAVGLPDEQFNRKPVNDFIMEACNGSKFMDDHLTNISEARRKVNFFRQLRNKSFDF